MTEKVRTNGEEEIPPHRWFEVLDKLSRVDDILALIAKEINRTNALLEQLLAKPTVTLPPPVQLSLTPNNRSKVHTFDLTAAHTDKELGIGGMKVSHAIVLKCDSPCTWKRNSKTVDAEDLSVGYSIENYEITELYITNTAGAGQLKVLVEWRE
jgi:hypothetical protein